MLKWTLIFIVFSMIAGVLGFTGISVASSDIARILFFVFLVLFVCSLVGGMFRGGGKMISKNL